MRNCLSGRTLISTAFLCTFILTCNPSISVNGPKIFTQSFFNGDIRCGGIATLLVSLFRLPRTAEAGAASKEGAEELALGKRDAEAESGSIMSSSSSCMSSFDGACATSVDVDGPPVACCSSSSMSTSSSAVRGAFFFEILRRFLRTGAGLTGVVVV